MITSTFTHSAREWIPTKQETLEAMLATKEPNEKYSALIHPSTQEFIDFDVMGHSVESANLGAKKAQEKVAALERQEEEEKAEQTRDSVTASIASMEAYHEQQMEKLYNFDGNEFTQEDVKKALDENMDKYLQEVEEDNLPEFLMLTEKLESGEALTDQEIKRLVEITPSLAKDSGLVNKNSTSELDAKQDKDMTEKEINVTEAKLDDIDEMLADLEDSDFAQESYAEAMDAIKDSNIVKTAQVTVDQNQALDAPVENTPVVSNNNLGLG